MHILLIVTILKLIMIILYIKEAKIGYNLTVPVNYFKWILTYALFGAFLSQEVSMTHLEEPVWLNQR